MTPMHPQVLLQNFKGNRSASIDEYRANGGYEALTRALLERTPAEVEQMVLAAGLRGRGGAGFPAGKKWSLIPEGAAHPRFVVVNADEMEPGTYKDRMVIHVDPHLIIEGVILTSYAVSAEKAYIFIRPSYESSALILERELEVARREGLLGQNILGSEFSLDIVVHRSAGRYICGEATALLNALMGKRPNPKQPPPYATEKGLWNLPTVVGNVETTACVAPIVRNAITGGSGEPAFTKLYCVSGKVKRPGCYELPMGTPLREIIEEAAGGLPEGSELKAVLPGGVSTRYMTPDLYDTPMDFDSLAKIGHRLGTGAIIVFDQHTCMVAATLNIIQFFARESCGWCTPCREGLPYIRYILTQIESGEGKDEMIPKLRRMSEHLWRTYCAFSPGAVSPLESLLTYFEDEVREHIRMKRCPFRK